MTEKAFRPQLVLFPFYSANRVKVLYGLLKEPELSMPVDDETETEDGDKPKVKYYLSYFSCQL